MDIFYRPPAQRMDECKVLEENYMNCMLQKAMKDKVFVNQCVLDSVLWFHLECPRAAGRFDDPVEFKRKWRDFFSLRKSMIDNTKLTATQKRLEKEFAYTNAYPEDVKINKKVAKFQEEFHKYTTDVTPYEEGEPDADEGWDWKQQIENKDMLYGRRSEEHQADPITLLESQAGRDDLMGKK